MKILCVSDEESPALWDHYVPGRLKEYDLILSAGDLNASYLSFLVTMARCPVFYVHGNHDTSYDHRPPEGCDCIGGYLVEYNGCGNCALPCGGPRAWILWSPTRLPEALVIWTILPIRALRCFWS